MPLPPQDMREHPLDAFSAVLTEAVRRAYADLHRDRGNESFYAAGLAYADEPSALMVAANSHEALDRVVARYVANGADAEVVADTIRWSRVTEWEYHRYAEPTLNEANHLLEDVYVAHKSWVWGFPPDERPGATLRELDARVLMVLRDVVRDLDGDAVFAGNQPRDSVVVNLWSTVGNERDTLERASWFNTAAQLVPMRRTLRPPE
jgi:hypothetical protein